MSVSLWISLILACFPAAGTQTIPCLSTNPLSQVIRAQVKGTASISCDISSQCPSVTQTTWWFMFNKSDHHKLDLSTSKYYLQGTDLMITLTSPEDNGVYVCAVWRDTIGPGEQLIGQGITLVVGGNTEVWHSLLWVLFALLTIYNLSIMIIIYRKKTRAPRKPCALKESNSSSRLHFRSVVEELYNRRNLHNKEADKGSREGQPCKAEDARSKPKSNEDLYQNL